MNFKRKKNAIILVSIPITLLIGGVIVVLLYFVNNGCLSKNEIASYEIKREDGTRKGIINILISSDGIVKKFFLTDTPSYNHYHPVELKKCYVYVIQALNFDYKKDELLPNSTEDLWKYDYKGKSEKLFSFYKRDKIGNYTLLYSLDFRVDPTEKYVALYTGSPTYAFVIKNLKNLKDDFVLPVSDILKKYPSASGGGSDLNLWSKDGKYFWGNLSDGADALAFIRIEAETWKWDVFPAPAGTMGGDVINPENGWVTYDDGIPWTGDADWTEEYIKEWKKEGKKIHFYIYNLITKEQILLATIDDPAWGFGKKWLSDTELEYTLPGDIKKVYKID